MFPFGLVSALCGALVSLGILAVIPAHTEIERMEFTPEGIAVDQHNNSAGYAEILQNQPLRLESYPDTTSIVFSDGQYNGFDACNSLGGSADIEGDTVTFSAPVSTMKMCLPEDEEANRSYHDMIDGKRMVTWQDSKIVLASDDGRTWALIPYSDPIP